MDFTTYMYKRPFTTFIFLKVKYKLKKKKNNKLNVESY